MHPKMEEYTLTQQLLPNGLINSRELNKETMYLIQLGAEQTQVVIILRNLVYLNTLLTTKATMHNYKEMFSHQKDKKENM